MAAKDRGFFERSKLLGNVACGRIWGAFPILVRPRQIVVVAFGVTLQASPPVALFFGDGIVLPYNR